MSTAPARLVPPGAPTAAPPEAWEPLFRLARLARRPLERFFRIQAASGIVLLLAAAVALLWANSPWAASYVQLWQTPLRIGIGGLSFERPLAWVVNDGLMVLFFFVVGLEIRREIHHGELSEWRRAALPAGAALGGMMAPALLYLLIAGAPPARSGWGVPMATDIAFAVGVLALLGARVPAIAFHEFTGTRSPKTRWRFTVAGAAWFCIAGVWRTLRAVDRTGPPGTDHAARQGGRQSTPTRNHGSCVRERSAGTISRAIDPHAQGRRR